MTDVLIAGAGLIGSSIAWRLSQAGASVTLCDAGTLGGETSSAGAGMLSPGGEFDKPSVWIDLAVEGMRMYPAFVEELASETGVPIDFQICGCHHFVGSETAQRRAAFQSSKSIRVEITDRGLFYPGDAFVDPTDMLRALRSASKADLREHRAISEIESGEYGAVVLAAGAWSSQIRVTYRSRLVPLPSVKPIKGHLIGFQLEPGSLGPMLRRGHTYVLQRSSGFTIAGSNEEDAGFDRSVDPATCEEIHRGAAQLFPVLERATPCRRWIGHRPFSPDGPHIRNVEGTNVWLAYGHFRNGILLTPLTAQRIANGISGFFASAQSRER
ncbi:MAG TPA: FAD-dependent oxidoreductase [Bryobacteraceae bacterium]|nr:FAD-dependent oxidoreductase [Bryobacteraceae bacterium]